MVTCHKGQLTSLSHAAPSISGNQCCPATFRNRAIFSSAFSSLDRFNSVIPHYPATQPQSAQMQKVAATSTSVTHDLIFNPKGKKMVPFFHVMISYRVSTEKHLARQMFDRLLLNSFKRIPTAGMSQWPDGFENQRPGHANIFLDQVCLKSGEDWKHSKEGGGFVNAVLKSLIFVPLLSWKVEVEPEKKEDPKVELENKEVHVSKSKMRFKGSVGDMVAKYSKQSLDSFIDPSPVERPFHDTVDNVLLELILAMELHEHLNRIHKGASCMYPCLRLFPIIIDNFPDFSQLPDKISELTYADAAKYLGPNGIHIKDKKTVREIVSFFFGVQAVTFSDFGKEDFALDTVCSKIISAVSDSVAKIDPLSLFESKPLCKELDAFLSKRNCSYMTSILAANNITSLRQLSFLTHQQAIYDLAKQCSSVSSKSAVAELTTLSSLIDESKHDEGSWLLSTRLDRFVDRDASFETVIKSSSGLIISAAQKSWLTMYFIVGAAFLVLGIMSVLSIGPGGNTILDFVGCAFLFSVCLAAVFHSPKRAYTVYCCMWPAWAVSIVIGFFIDFTENGSFSLDNASRCLNVGSQLQTSFRSCAIAQIMCGPLLLLCMMLLMLYQSLRRQDLAWNTALLCLIFYLVTEVAFELRVLGFSYSDSGPVTNYVIVSFLACIIALTESMNGLARRRARKSVAKDEKMYQDRWKALLKTKDEEFQLKQLTKNHLDPMSQDLEKFLLSSGSVQLLQDCKDIDVLYARAEFINEAFQSLVSILLESSPSAVEAKLTSEEKAAVEAHASSEAKPTSDSGVDHHGCANISAMKKELKAFFADDDVEEILKNLSHYEEIFKHLKPHNGVETSCQHAKEGDMSVKTIVQQQQQQQQQHLPGYIEQDDQPVKTAHDVETRVDMKRDSVEHGAQDHNKTINQDTQKGDGSVKSTEHSSGAKPDLARNHKVDDKATDIVTAHTVVVRRGPVKLPARAIAKSYRAYKSQVDRLTDIVRSSVDCGSFSAVNAAVQMLRSVGYVRPMEEVKPVDSDEPLESTESRPGNAFSSILARFIRTGSHPSIVAPEEHPQPCQDAPHVMEEVKPVDSDEPLKPTELSPGNAFSSILARFIHSMFAPEMQPQPYEDATKGKILEILRIRNRFDSAINQDSPHWSGGFRDLAFKVKVGFKESSNGAPQFVPVNRWGESSVKTFVCELQIHHEGMLPSKLLASNSTGVQQQGGAAPRKSQFRAEDFHKRYVKMRDALAK